MAIDTIPPPSPPNQRVSRLENDRVLSRCLLVLILLLAFTLRAWNLDWDDGTKLQPDERFWSDVAANVERPADWSWAQVLDPEQSPLNPRVHKPNYVYGTLPLWASEAAAAVLMTAPMEPLVGAIDAAGINLVHDDRPEASTGDKLRFNTGYDVTIIGRLLSALVDTLTVVGVYLLARELADRTTGLVAASLQALTVLHIQYSHFLGSEPWVAFFVTIVVWGSVRLARGRGGGPTRLITAVALGFAIGSKLSGIAAAAAPVMAVIVALWPELTAVLRGRVPVGTSRRMFAAVEPWLVMAVFAIAAYRLAQPYDFQAGISLVFNDRFQQDVDYLQDINQGGNWPWVQPLVGATPLVHPLKQVFFWGMGPGLALAAIFGGIRAIRRFMHGERFWAIPLAVIGAYFVLVSLQFYAIIRYIQPAYPAMVALAGVGLVAAWRWAAAIEVDRARLAAVVRGAVILSIGTTVFWALAFVNGVYGQDNARLAAGDWMIENLPPDAVVSQQAWDDGVPWGRSSTFGRVTLEPFSFGGDTPERIELLLEGLDQVDYVIETSNKFYDALPRTPARFPQMTEYYERLFDGSLGFELIAEFSNPPSLFGITIDDSHAEEAFTLYDHPTVFIWEKTDAYSPARARALLNPDRARTAVNAIPGDAYANASMLRPDAYDTQQQGSSFSDVHTAGSNSFLSAVSWFVLLQAASLAVTPILLVQSGRAAGAVYGLSKVLGLIVLAFPTWLLVSWNWFDLSSRIVWLALIALLGFGVVTAVRWQDRLREIWREHRSAILLAEAVFVTVFLAVIALRLANPDLWHPGRGGEKPMELAYFTAVTGSTTLPPYDPWLAGGSLNYYYLGWFLLAVPTRILGLQPDIAFNLGVATYAAIAAVTVFSTAAVLANLASRRSALRISPGGTGLLAAILFLVIGNLDGFRQVVLRWRDGQGWERIRDFDWWDPSRVNKGSTGFEVTEFPAFTVLFADLHPHFMAMGIFGLGLAGAAALIERMRQGRRRQAWFLVVGLGVGSGIMRMVHTWDLPTFGLVAAGAVLFGAFVADAPGWWRARTAFAQLVTLGAAHLFVTAPYRGSNQVADSGFKRAASNTNLDDWVVHWGVFLFVALAYLGVRVWQLRHRFESAAATLLILIVAVLVGSFMLNSAVGSVAAWSWFAALAMAAVLMLEIRNDRVSTAHVMVAAIWALGFAVLTGVEIFTQNADIQRLNTVFKFWLQVWHLFAVGAAFGAVWIAASARRLLAGIENRPFSVTQRGTSIAALFVVAVVLALASPFALWVVVALFVVLAGLAWVADLRRLAEYGRFGFVGGLAVLVLLGAVYPYLAVGPRTADRIDTALGPSLQGHLWMEQPGTTSFGIKDAFENEFTIDPALDRPVIEWLQANVEGRPTIVEAVGGAEYQWWGRISINTGLPTVLGWRWHQDQQRTLFNYEVNERKRDVASFFVLPSVVEVEKFLRAYDVSYVVIGAVEAEIADPALLQVLHDHPSLNPVFRRGEQVIYEVEKQLLAELSSGQVALGPS